MASKKKVTKLSDFIDNSKEEKERQKEKEQVRSSFHDNDRVTSLLNDAREIALNNKRIASGTMEGEITYKHLNDIGTAYKQPEKSRREQLFDNAREIVASGTWGQKKAEHEYMRTLSYDEQRIYKRMKDTGSASYVSPYLSAGIEGKEKLEYNDPKWNALNENQKRMYLEWAQDATRPTDSDNYYLNYARKILYDAGNESINYKEALKDSSFLDRYKRLFAEPTGAGLPSMSGETTFDLESERKWMFYTLPEEVQNYLIRGDAVNAQEIEQYLKANYDDYNRRMLNSFAEEVRNIQDRESRDNAVTEFMNRNAVTAGLAQITRLGGDTVGSAIAGLQSKYNYLVHGDTNTHQTFFQQWADMADDIKAEQDENLSYLSPAMKRYFDTSYSIAENYARLQTARVASAGLTFLPEGTAAQMAFKAGAYKTVTGLAMNRIVANGVFNDVFQQSLEQGMGAGEAFSRGLAHALFEGAFETISFDKMGFFNEKPVLGSFGQFVKSLIKAGFVEGTEEINTGIAQELYDYLLAYDYSDYKAWKDKYDAKLGRETTDSEAWGEYWKTFLANRAEDFLGGALSGMAMGAVESGAAYRRGQEYTSEGRLMSNEDFSRMTDVAQGYAMMFPRIAEEYSEAKEAGEAVERGYVKRLTDAISEKINSRIEKAKNIDALQGVMESANEALNGAIQQETFNKFNAKLQELGNENAQVTYEDYMRRRDSSPESTFSDLAYGKGDNVLSRNIVEAKRTALEAIENPTLNQRQKNIEMENAADRIAKSKDLAEEMVAKYAQAGLAYDSPEVRQYYGVLGLEGTAKAYSAAKIAKEAEANPMKASTRGAMRALNQDDLKYFREEAIPHISAITHEQLMATENGRLLADAADVINKMGFNVVFYQSDREVAPNGMHVNGTIYVDVQAGKTGAHAALGEVFSHELTHAIKYRSESDYASIRDFLKSDMNEGEFEKLVKNRMERFKENREKAEEEVVATACQRMLENSEVFQRFAAQDEKTALKIFNKLVEFLKRIRAMFRESLGNREMEAVNHYEELVKKWDEALANVIGLNKEVSAKDSVEVQEAMEGKGNIVSNSYRNADGELEVAETVDGRVMYSERTYLNGGRSKIIETLQKKGYSDAEIDKVTNYIDNRLKYIKEIGDEFAKQNFDALQKNLDADISVDMATEERLLQKIDGFLPNDVIQTLRHEHQTMFAYVSNGDYAMNIDLQLSCKKRIAYEKVINALIDSGAMGDVRLSGELIGEINQVLAANEFETQCLGCFVEARRQQMQKWAETIVTEWNEQVMKNTDLKMKDLKKEDFLHAVNGMDSYEAHLILEEAIKEDKSRKGENGKIKLKSKSVYDKMGELIRFNPKLYGHFLQVKDILTADGLKKIRAIDDGNMFSLIKSRYGVASPKILQSFNPYNSEVLDLTFSSIKKMTGNGVTGSKKYVDAAKKTITDADLAHIDETIMKYYDGANLKKADRDKMVTAMKNEMIQERAVRNYLLDVGGNRIQSFSDFMIENVFDMLQIFSDFAIRDYSVHGYTKEQICLRLFGMTGAKWNASWIAHNLKEMGKEKSGLIPWTEENAKNGITVEVDGEKYVIQFDDYQRHVREKSFIQSIGFKDAVAIMLDPRYTDNVGTITIGFSDKHIRAMLNNPYFRMVIPYHASGMIAGFAEFVGASTYNDYTPYQSTSLNQVIVKENGKSIVLNSTYVEEKDEDGNVKKGGGGYKFTYKGKDYTIKPDFTYRFNEALQRTGDARKAAQDYIDWCRSEHKQKVAGLNVYATYNPAFSNSPYGYDFTQEVNYYKLLEDFNVYNSREEIINGNSINARQAGVKMLYAGDEGGTLSSAQLAQYRQDLIQTGMFDEKEVEKYVRKAQMTFDELVKEEVASRNAYNENVMGKDDAKLKAVIEDIKKDILPKYMRATEVANDREDYKKSADQAAKKGDASKLKRTDTASYFHGDESSRDSDGNELSEAQSEYFKDSVIRDEDGNLLVVYNGTPNKTKTKFGYARVGGNGGVNHGYGFYFTPSKKEASLYMNGDGKVISAYLNIKDPINALDRVSEEFFDRFVEYIPSQGLRSLVETFGSIKAAKEYYVGDQFETFLVSVPRKTDITPETLNNKILMKMGYDGVVYKEDGYEPEYVAFRSNQIKEISNTNPTDNDDIRYSLREVDPVEPESNDWSRTHTTEEAMQMAAEKGIKMWDVSAESSDKANATQMTLGYNDKEIKGTTSTYNKVYKFLGKDYKGRILDASSGRGYGTRYGRDMYGLNITDIEPYPDATKYQFLANADAYDESGAPINPRHPDYTDYQELDRLVKSGEVEPFDFIISNAVLNVLPQDLRDSLVQHMGDLLADGGQMFINVRPSEDIRKLANNPKNAKLGDHEAVESAHGSYQYGFEKGELKAYIQDALGNGFVVEDKSDVRKRLGRDVFDTNSPYVLVTKNDVNYSERSAKEINDEYMNEALPSGNEDWMKQLANEAAYNAGYTVGAYHGSPVTDITTFKTRSDGEKKEKLQLLFGTHFTREPSFAELYTHKRIGAKGTAASVRKGGRVYDVYLDLGKSLDLIHAKNYQAGEELYDLYQDMPEKIKKKVKPHTYTAYETSVGMGEGEYINTGDIERALQEMTPKEATEFLVNHGYNSVEYSANYVGGIRNVRDNSIIMLDANRIKSADPITYDDNGNVIPLSERFNKESDDIRYSERDISSINDDYMEAVANHDTDTEKRLVEEAAKKAGFTKRLFHGTNAFGFTTIDVNRPEADGFSFWAADREDIAGTYTRNGETRAIASSEADEYELLDGMHKKIADKAHDFRRLVDKYFSPWYYGQTDDSDIIKLVEEGWDYEDFTDAVYDMYESYGEAYEDKYEDWYEFEEGDEFYELASAFNELEVLGEHYREIENGNIQGGVYELFANTDNFYEYNGNGALWKELKPTAEMNMPSDKLLRTRDIVAWAREQGYDGVHFENIRDNGDYGRTEAGDVYAFFKPTRQVKSADAETYDDNGDVIPLTERFNEENDDIRYSYRDLAETESEILVKALRDKELAEELGARQSVEAYAREYNRLKDMEKQVLAISKQLNKKDTTPSEREALMKKVIRLDRAILKKTEELSGLRNQKVLRDILINAWNKRAKDVAWTNELTYRKTKQALEDKYGEEIASVKAKAKEQKQAIRDRFVSQGRTKNIIKKVNDLMNMIVHPTEKKHIPAPLIQPVVDMLEGLDTWTPAEGRTQTKKQVSLYQRFEKFKSTYEDYLKENVEKAANGETDIADIFDPEFLDMATQLTNYIRDNDVVNINDLDAQSLVTLDRLLTELQHIIKQGNRMFVQSQYETIDELKDLTVDNLTKRKGLTEDRTNQMGNPAQRLVSGMSDGYAWERIVGDGAHEIMKAMSQAYNRKVGLVREAEKFADEALAPVRKDLPKWEKEKISFKLNSGKTIKLTVRQMIDLYNTSMREQGFKHIVSDTTEEMLEKRFNREAGEEYRQENDVKLEDYLNGEGIRIKDRKGRYQKISKMTLGDLNNIIDYLRSVPHAIEVADKFRDFMKVAAQWGNKATMQMYGIVKFVEDVYWPIRSAEESMKASDSQFRKNEMSMDKLKNLGFTKETVKNARNAIYIEDFLDVFSDHVDKMSSYSEVLPAITDAMRWWNAPTGLEDSKRIKDLVEAKFGKDMAKNFTGLIASLNGGTKGDDTLSQAARKLMGSVKAAAIAMNARVVVQQPMAIVRARMAIEDEYLLKALRMPPAIKEAQEHSNLAWLKHQGFYSSGLSPSIKKLITGDATLAEKITEKTMSPAGLADDMTWGIIWNAAMLKVNKTQPNLKQGTQECYDAIDDVFCDIINYTQVVDTPFTRSPWMRANGIAATYTAFMNEPMKTFSMLSTAIDKVVQNPKDLKAWRTVGNAALTFMLNGFALAAVQSLVDAMRDDDKEKNYWEKYISKYMKNAGDNLNPLNLIPIVKDLSSYFVQGGYVNNNLVMQGVSNLGAAVSEIKKIANGTTKHTPFGSMEVFAKAYSYLTGQPWSNGMRIINSVFGNLMGVDAFRRNKYTNSEFGRNVILELRDGDYEQAEKYYDDLSKSVKGDEKKINGYISDYLAEKDENVAELAISFLEDATTLDEAVSAIMAMYTASYITEDVAVAAIRKAANLYEKEEAEENDEEYVKRVSTTSAGGTIYNSSDINRSLEAGKVFEAQSIIDEINKGYKASGSSSTAKQGISDYWKPRYLAATGAERDRIARMLYQLRNNGKQMFSRQDLQRWVEDAKKKNK